MPRHEFGYGDAVNMIELNNLRAENLRLRSALEQAQAQVAELRGVLEEIKDEAAGGNWDMQNLRNLAEVGLSASDGGKLSEETRLLRTIAEFGPRVMGVFNDKRYRIKIDTMIDDPARDKINSFDEALGALAAWRGEE